MSQDNSATTYSKSGVDYEVMDPIKKLAQEKAKETSANLNSENSKVIEESRGDSAFVWEEGDAYRALVIEGLGTKNLVADEMQKLTGKSFYKEIAQDTVASIINDVIVVGAKPQVLNAYFGLGDSNWLKDETRAKDLIEGFVSSCNLAGCVWGGGETPTLKGIINPETIDLAGSVIGIISPKNRLTLGDKLAEGDVILLIESNGIHANGLSLARSVAEKLPEGYLTKLANGQTYGEELLKPTYIYASVIQALFEQEIDIHYLVNITGHGFRKLMRAKKDFTYTINNLPEVPELFKFIQEESGNSDEEMYGNFNMGAGFAIFLPKDQAEKAQAIIKKNNFKSWISGIVEMGDKKVVINELNISFEKETLGVR